MMRRSLTATPGPARLRISLAAQQNGCASGATEVTSARAAIATAQAGLTAAAAADTAARTRYLAATQAVAGARKTMLRVQRQRPYRSARVAHAKSAVAIVTKTMITRRAQSGKATAALTAARTGLSIATTRLAGATSRWKTTCAAVKVTQQKLTGTAPTAELTARAAAISRDVVTQVRATFTTADATTVYGITVHRSVAFAFQRMIDDAKADGIVLSGGGFRTRQRQIELRKINGCPDISTAPASSCRVPTAIPGRSLHEIGLAVDITSGGKTLTAKSAGFAWLKAHADEYGFANLPSEPWHWSITGS
ncbi:D-alanyl-D-alanine carboxypeptidase [Actinoplanes sp. TBRC 11911]|nr:D-alanyl-D-alanine carboxypeptidase [Actinoplanes sp. TBRC 11911]